MSNDSPPKKKNNVFAVIGVVAILLVAAVVGVLSINAMEDDDEKKQYEDQLREEAEMREDNASKTQFQLNADLFEYSSLAPINGAAISTYYSKIYNDQINVASTIEWLSGNDLDANQIYFDCGLYESVLFSLEDYLDVGSEFFDNVSSYVAKWQNTDYCRDKMHLTVNVGSNSILSTKSDFSGRMVVVAEPESSMNKVILSGNQLYVEGGDATIFSSKGEEIQLKEGYNYLDSDFKLDVYTLQNDRTYAGNILGLYGIPISLTIGTLLNADGHWELVSGMDNSILYEGDVYNSFSISLCPEGGNIYNVDISKLIFEYMTGHSFFCNYMPIITHYSELDHGVQILPESVPNEYNGLTLSKTQKDVLMILAAEQMAEYWETSGTLKDRYYMSEESLKTYFLGDITDSKGNVIVSDIIFTPFFYVKDTTLSIATNTLDQDCLVAIWKENAISFSGWGGNYDVGSKLISLQRGCHLVVSDIIYNNMPVGYVAFNIIDMSVSPKSMTDQPDLNLNAEAYKMIRICDGFRASQS